MILPIVSQLSPAALAELDSYIEAKIREALAAHREQKRWLTPRQAAVYLGTSEAAIRHRITRGRIPTVRQGRSVLIDRAQLDRELDRGA